VTLPLLLLRFNLSFLNCAEHRIRSCGRPACLEKQAMEFVNFADSSHFVVDSKLLEAPQPIADSVLRKWIMRSTQHVALQNFCLEKSQMYSQNVMFRVEISGNNRFSGSHKRSLKSRA
jgi:hypothetical protein